MGYYTRRANEIIENTKELLNKMNKKEEKEFEYKLKLWSEKTKQKWEVKKKTFPF
jgi:hypothetical protein